jgi:hypothetical protein
MVTIPGKTLFSTPMLNIHPASAIAARIVTIKPASAEKRRRISDWPEEGVMKLKLAD